MGYLNYNKITDYIGTNFQIWKNGKDVVFINRNDGYMYNDGTYIDTISNNLTSLKFMYGDILVVGLGIGVIPQWLSNTMPLVRTTILEIDSELIDVVESMDYLNSKINIISGDVYIYNSLKKYDAIIFDVWWVADNYTENQITELREKWNSTLRDDGKLIFPMINQSYKKII